MNKQLTPNSVENMRKRFDKISSEFVAEIGTMLTDLELSMESEATSMILHFGEGREETTVVDLTAEESNAYRALLSKFIDDRLKKVKV
jgi:hypothetical protein